MLTDTISLSLVRTRVCQCHCSDNRVHLVHTFQSSSCSQAVSKPVWHTPLLRVQRNTPDNGQRNCPKHVAFYSKYKFEKLVHLVGFIIQIYHDARSPERQMLCGLVLHIINKRKLGNGTVPSSCWSGWWKTENHKHSEFKWYTTWEIIHLLNAC